MKLKYFKDRDLLENLIEDYFNQTADDAPSKAKEKSSPTVTGLALHLGFNSKNEFDQYQIKGRYKKLIERARFKVMAYYESRLHYPSPTGAMFALKCMGWNDAGKIAEPNPGERSINVKLIETGPEPASSEKEVEL